MSTGTPADPPAPADEPEPPVDPSVDPSVDPMDRPMGLGIDFSDPNSPLAPYYLRATGVLVALVLGLTLGWYSNQPLLHTDVWVHLKLGRWVVEHRGLPTAEPFSPYTDKSAAFTNLPWLTQVAYHLTFTAGQSLAGGDAARRFVGGGDLLRQLHVVAVVAYFALLALAFRRTSGSGALQLLGLVLAFLASMITVGLHRPQTFGLVGYAAVLAALSRPVLSRRAVFAIPPVLVLWANLHGSFVVGFGLFGLAWLGRVVASFGSVPTGRVKQVVADLQVRRLTITIFAGLVAVAAANPFGPHIYPLAAGFGGNPNLKLLGEWQPIDFRVLAGGVGAVRGGGGAAGGGPGGQPASVLPVPDAAPADVRCRPAVPDADDGVVDPAGDLDRRRPLRCGRREVGGGAAADGAQLPQDAAGRTRVRHLPNAGADGARVARWGPAGSENGVRVRHPRSTWWGWSPTPPPTRRSG